MGHRPAMVDPRHHPDPDRGRRQRRAVHRVLVGLPRVLRRRQPAAPRTRIAGEHLRQEHQRPLRHRAGGSRRHVGSGTYRRHLADRTRLADPVLDPRRLPHQLPAHHGRRRRPPGARSGGRGDSRRCRGAVPYPRRRPRRAGARGTSHRARRRRQRRQRHRGLAGRRRDTRRRDGRGVRARSRR